MLGTLPSVQPPLTHLGSQREREGLEVRGSPNFRDSLLPGKLLQDFFCGGLVTNSCPTLVTPLTGSLPRSCPRISQARILGWVALFFSRGSSPPRDQSQVSRIAGGFFTEPLGKRTVFLLKDSVSLLFIPSVWSLALKEVSLVFSDNT